MPLKRLRLRFSIVGSVAFVAVAASMSAVDAQQVILSEDFEGDSPGAFPGTADFFAKSSVLSFDADFDGNKIVNGDDFSAWQRGFGSGTTKAEGDANGSGSVDGADLGIWQSEYGMGDPATIEVTGGAFADPFDPGNNQSMILHNPGGSSQMSVTWVDEFMDDPNTFRNGVIEFDLWMDSPDPEAFWTFLGVRVGHGDETRSAAQPTSSTMTVWNTFRMQNQGEDPDPVVVLEQASDPGHRIGLGVEPTYNDDNSSPTAGAFGPDQPVSVRFEIAENGYSLQDLPTYKLFLNDNQIEWTGTAVGDSMEHPWVLGPGLTLQPGINVLTFITDASAFGANSNPGTGNVYIDNLVITNNDLPPLSAAAYDVVPEPSSVVLASALVLLQLQRRIRFF